MLKLILLGLVSATPVFAAPKDYKPCGIHLAHVDPISAMPGEIFRMHGRWGPEQGEKVAGINKGSGNILPIESWSDTVLVARVPKNLEVGHYKVGVYCRDVAKGGTYSSGWKNFWVGGKVMRSIGETVNALEDLGRKRRSARRYGRSVNYQGDPSYEKLKRLAVKILGWAALLVFVIVLLMLRSRSEVDFRGSSGGSGSAQNQDSPR